MYSRLAEAGAHNIDLVTPTHYSEAVLASLEKPCGIPVVYNSNGYDAVDTLRRFEGKIQIYLPDFKYASPERAGKYSGAADYPEAVVAALQEMYRQTGDYEIDEDGIMKKGVIVRHLMLPGGLEDTLQVIRTVACLFKPGQVLFSLMRQYLPCGRVLQGEFPELNSKVSTRAYERAVQEMFACGMEDGFVQGRRSAHEEFIPFFDGTGVRKQ
jgi:putative pyruvate formate lyase activating enzyme